MNHNTAKALIQRQSTRVFRLCYSYVKNQHDAEDLMQEVFVRYLEHSPLFETEKQENAWFLKVAANSAKSHLRKMRLRRHEDIDTLSLESETADECDRISVLEAVLKLPEKMRICIHLHYYEGLPQEQIAGILACPISTVKSHLRRAKAALKAQLGETL